MPSVLEGPGVQRQLPHDGQPLGGCHLLDVAVVLVFRSVDDSDPPSIVVLHDEFPWEEATEIMPDYSHTRKTSHGAPSIGEN